jgi:transposase
MSKHRSFTPEFKAQVVLEILSGAKTTAEVCREHELSAQVINHWKAELVQNASKLFQVDGRVTAEQTRIAELERLVGRLTLQLEISKKASSLLSARRRKNEL